jgi:DNA-binding HxlR family transcriptional regulator
MMESVFACKWSAHILSLIRDGVNRPGAITRGLDGLTTKVLNECLRRLISFGLLERMSYPEIPPRVEYKLTKLGERFVFILDAVEELQLIHLSSYARLSIKGLWAQSLSRDDVVVTNLEAAINLHAITDQEQRGYPCSPTLASDNPAWLPSTWRDRSVLWSERDRERPPESMATMVW